MGMVSRSNTDLLTYTWFSQVWTSNLNIFNFEIFKTYFIRVCQFVEGENHDKTGAAHYFGPKLFVRRARAIIFDRAMFKVPDYFLWSKLISRIFNLCVYFYYKKNKKNHGENLNLMFLRKLQKRQLLALV